MSLPIRNNSPLLFKKTRSEAYAGLFVLGASALLLTVYRGFGRCEIQSLNQRQLGEPWQISRGDLPQGVSYGNGLLDGQQHAGWFVGHFVDEGKPQHTEDIEIKFTFNPTGKKNDGFVANRMSRSMAVLISGKHLLDFGNTSILLERPGDYAIWSAGVGHSWTSIMDSTVLTVRWPSIPKDQVPTDNRLVRAPHLLQSGEMESHPVEEILGQPQTPEQAAQPDSNAQSDGQKQVSEGQGETNSQGQGETNGLVVSNRQPAAIEQGNGHVAEAGNNASVTDGAQLEAHARVAALGEVDTNPAGELSLNVKDPVTV
jgi:hypothetical protein